MSQQNRTRSASTDQAVLAVIHAAAYPAPKFVESDNVTLGGMQATCLYSQGGYNDTPVLTARRFEGQIQDLDPKKYHNLTQKGSQSSARGSLLEVYEARSSFKVNVNHAAKTREVYEITIQPLI